MEQGQARPEGSRAVNGKFSCGPLVENPGGDVMVTAEKRNGEVAVHLGAGQNEPAKITIHRSVLAGIFRGRDPEGRRDRDNTAPTFQYTGKIISAQNDSIVANFETNALRQTKGPASSSRERPSTFFGFKARLGRRTDDGDGGAQDPVDIYFRIIIDANALVRSSGKRSSHRAAYVISEVPVRATDQPVREVFYRFLPNRRPFRMVVCALDRGQAI